MLINCGRVIVIKNKKMGRMDNWYWQMSKVCEYITKGDKML